MGKKKKSEKTPTWIWMLDLFCMAVGGYMVVIGVLLYMFNWKSLSVNVLVANFYSIFMGLLVFARCQHIRTP